MTNKYSVCLFMKHSLVSATFCDQSEAVVWCAPIGVSVRWLFTGAKCCPLQKWAGRRPRLNNKNPLLGHILRHSPGISASLLSSSSVKFMNSWSFVTKVFSLPELPGILFKSQMHVLWPCQQWPWWSTYHQIHWQVECMVTVWHGQTITCLVSGATSTTEYWPGLNDKTID